MTSLSTTHQRTRLGGGRPHHHVKRSALRAAAAGGVRRTLTRGRGCSRKQNFLAVLCVVAHHLLSLNPVSSTELFRP